MYPTSQPSWQSLVKSRLRQTMQLYLWVFVPMWLMFLLNNSVLFGLWNVFGIVPRELSVPSFIGILASWTMHANLAHITGNSLVMAQVLFLFGVFEKKAMMTIVFLIVGSGLFTWVFGSSNSLHIGASGLAFAMMGYMIGGALFARRWGYLIACVALGVGFWLAMLSNLMPQVGVSFAGHLGGLLTGIGVGASTRHPYSQSRLLR
ncbi:rhomboid family intramembrane serine protease [Moraxella lincolnii]|uniref:Rhomboid family intramembrane serine protease n=1 Tax=Lwoffella lincolnii TaxID=90241 RepID=A0A1T0CAQ3_9GAMM|nr:rhomboid family intramembrane serine protease [Moraxella lincolnii]OOS19448.1 rhomboid family intramembrane serine protease [Moraxella lincolnii]